MSRERLLGRIQRIRVHRVDRDATIMDEEAGEPYADGLEEMPAIVLDSQFEWASAKARTPAQGGPRIIAAATAVVLCEQATRLEWEPTDGDRVSAVIEPDGSELDVNLFVMRARTKGKTRRGLGHWLIELGDRAPVRASSEHAP